MLYQCNMEQITNRPEEEDNLQITSLLTLFGTQGMAGKMSSPNKCAWVKMSFIITSKLCVHVGLPDCNTLRVSEKQWHLPTCPQGITTQKTEHQHLHCHANFKSSNSTLLTTSSVPTFQQVRPHSPYLIGLILGNYT